MQECGGCGSKAYWAGEGSDETVVYCSSCGKDLFTVQNEFI